MSQPRPPVASGPAMIPTFRFRDDGPRRDLLWTDEAMQHPAKGNVFMWEKMVALYSQEGDTIFDPMSGIGTTLIAALMGRNVICLEKEHHFLLPMVRSWAKMRQHPMMGFGRMGQVLTLWGDARNLAGAQPWPYQELAVRFPKDTWETLKSRRRKFRLPLAARSLPLQSADCILTSPPYEEGLGHDAGEREIDKAKGLHNARGMASYTRRALDATVGAVITSPNYEGTNIGRNESLGEAPFGGPNSQARGFKYTAAKGENIGNLRGAAYWEAQSAVYAECWRILRPGGILALVVKGFTRDGEYQDLPGQTEALLLAAGWQKHDEWRRELWSLSFWRILQGTDKEEKVVAHRRDMFGLDLLEVKTMKRVSNGKLDDRLRYEQVLAFRHTYGMGQVALVLMSPPYSEALAHGGGGFNSDKALGDGYTAARNRDAGGVA